MLHWRFLPAVGQTGIFRPDAVNRLLVPCRPAAMGTPVTVQVSGLAGPRCTVRASTQWTILQVHEAIYEGLDIPVDCQILLKGTNALALEASIAALVDSDSPEKLQLTLLVQEAVEPKALHEAIDHGDAAAALSLLKRHRLPGLNDLWEGGETVLLTAIGNELTEVAVAILAKADFTAVNVKAGEDYDGWTALHAAASWGLLDVCKAILARADFTGVLDTIAGRGLSASQIAWEHGYQEVADLLREAEHRARISRASRSAS